MKTEKEVKAYLEGLESAKEYLGEAEDSRAIRQIESEIYAIQWVLDGEKKEEKK